MWDGNESYELPWYYYPDSFVNARLRPEDVTLDLYGTHFSNDVIKTICSYLGHHSNIIVEVVNEDIKY